VFKFNPKWQYMMPAHFGLRPRGRGPAPEYHDVTTMSVTYLTDGEMLSQYLPEPFSIHPEPLIHVSYSMNREVDWLAGGSYNLIGVNTSVVFNGEVDKNVIGTFCLVMWENDCDPIIAGREYLGIPKVYADIEDHSIIEGEWRTSASLRSHKILDLEITGLEAVSAADVKEMNVRAKDGNWMGWKYVPNTGEPGAAVSHATCNPTSGGTRQAWTGAGKVDWHRLTWEQNPAQCHIVNALADLPIIEYRRAMVLKQGTALETADRKLRMLT